MRRRNRTTRGLAPGSPDRPTPNHLCESLPQLAATAARSGTGRRPAPDDARSPPAQVSATRTHRAAAELQLGASRGVSGRVPRFLLPRRWRAHNHNKALPKMAARPTRPRRGRAGAGGGAKASPAPPARPRLLHAPSLAPPTGAHAHGRCSGDRRRRSERQRAAARTAVVPCPAPSPPSAAARGRARSPPPLCRGEPCFSARRLRGGDQLGLILPFHCLSRHSGLGACERVGGCVRCARFNTPLRPAPSHTPPLGKHASPNYLYRCSPVGVCVCRPLPTFGSCLPRARASLRLQPPAGLAAGLWSPARLGPRRCPLAVLVPPDRWRHAPVPAPGGFRV